MIAIGLGCRKHCPGAEIAALVREALARARIEGEPHLFSIIDKQDETGLSDAAKLLAMPLHFLPRAALAGQMAQVVTRSQKAARLYGLESISEAAALAGAGTGARLILPRISNAGATCAIALGDAQ